MLDTVGCHGELKEKNKQNYGEALPVYGCLVCTSVISNLPVGFRTCGPPTTPSHQMPQVFYSQSIHFCEVLVLTNKFMCAVAD